MDKQEMPGLPPVDRDADWHRQYTAHQMYAYANDCLHIERTAQTAEIARLTAKLEVLARDAGRYEKLRNCRRDYPMVCFQEGLDDSGWYGVCGADLDEAVDEMEDEPR